MKKLSVCLGYFDSVHMGHRKLIAKSRDYASSHGMVSAVYTFCEDEVGLFNSLYSFEQREILLKKAGAFLILSDIFSERFMQKTGEEFLDGLAKNFNVGAFFCGYDYTFGSGASCNAQFLLDYATHNKIKCFVLPPVLDDNEKVSTTRIKRLLAEGDLEKANKLLCDPFFMTGRVVHGRGVGSSFGYPTANLEYNGFLPRQGVYKTLVSFDGEKHIGVTNIGPKPTFDISSVSIETMLVDFSGDLYGKEIKIEFIKYLRPITKFKDGNDLNRQIQSDIKEALC